MTIADGTAARRTAWYMAAANAACTMLVLLSPIGIGTGSGVIGFSIWRMLIMIFVQSPILLSGLIAAFRAMTKQQRWVAAMATNLAVFAATFFLYFAQSRTIGLLIDS